MRKQKELCRTKLRCAVYTRKSTDEGLDQAFNTLDAQREACEAYIKSQAGEGWTLVPDHYDDGGFSGGNMDRPALQRLLGEVDAAKVDIIVVYKVDRLTRSLMDFSRIVERLDARDVSFVSVTQAFNTTSSMGRLTLNVLLSFAQFEREVTGERIRDKIAASKAKGMWMGGNLPLGYDLGDRLLVPNPEEAEQVCRIFTRYLELGSVPRLLDELRGAGVLSKRWVARKSGREIGGVPFGTGGLYYLLQNRIYLGEIVHKGAVHEGQHTAIVDRDLFEEVQQKLAEHRVARRERPTRAAACQLTGILFSGAGVPMRPSFGYGRKGKMYRYYVSADVLPGAAARGEPGALARVPAEALDNLVLELVTSATGAERPLVWDEASDLLVRVEIHDRSIQVLVDLAAFMEPHEPPDRALERFCARMNDGRLVSVGGTRFRLICDRRAKFRGGSAAPRNSAGPVSKANDLQPRALLRKAHELLERHSASPIDGNFSKAGAPPYQRERRIMQLGLLAPHLQRRIAEERTSVRCERIAALGELPLAWSDQHHLLVSE